MSAPLTATSDSIYAIHIDAGWVGHYGMTSCRKIRKTAKKALKDAEKLRAACAAKGEGS